MLPTTLHPGPTLSQDLFQYVYQALLPTIENTRECTALTQRIFTDYFQYNQLDIILNKTLLLTPHSINALTHIMQRLKQHEPIQYIVGKAPFMGRDFKVSPAVLIPRPETEELVTSILQENKLPHGSILDIGTGSGCIAITLKKTWPQAQIDALDCSTAALAIAATNAIYWQVNINWLQHDLLQQPLHNQQWDLIVSNPPYVTLAEKTWMHARVVNYEPAEALFVPDSKPLIFYEKIIQLLPQHLKPAGKVYLEINEAFGEPIAQKLALIGMQAIRICQDLHGKDRWITATMPA
jgi:release factor glutamine methyltransferase